MVDLNSSFMVRLSSNSNSSDSSTVESDNQTGTTIFVSVVFAAVLIVIILLSYRVFYVFCMRKRQKNRQQSICTERVSSLYPIHSTTISKSRAASVIYIIPDPSNTIVDAIDEIPPAYRSVTELKEIQSDPTTRL